MNQKVNLGNVKGTKSVKIVPFSGRSQFYQGKKPQLYKIDFFNYKPEGRGFDSLRAHHFFFLDRLRTFLGDLGFPATNENCSGAEPFFVN
jgi:hypothetical protein